MTPGPNTCGGYTMAETKHPSDESSSGERHERIGRISRAVGQINGFSRDAIGVHPYHVLFDSGLLATAVFAVFFSQYVSPIRTGRFLVAFVFTTVTFEMAYLRAKKWLFDIDSRSYLQDLIAYVLPVWIGTAVALGVDLRATLDLVGLQLALLLGFIRIGCFLGGCCYGKPSTYGIRYPKEVFESHDGNCQSFSPGDDPGCRVFPIQLVEFAVNLALFGALLWRISSVGVTGLTLPLYLLGYTTYRFVSDFFRLSSARPNWGPLSEAQWVSIATAVFVTVWLADYGKALFPPL